MLFYVHVLLLWHGVQAADPTTSPTTSPTEGPTSFPTEAPHEDHDDHDHDHEEGEEWWAAYDMEEGQYMLHIEKNASMLYDSEEYEFFFFGFDDSIDFDDIDHEALEDEANHHIEDEGESPIELEFGDVATPYTLATVSTTTEEMLPYHIEMNEDSFRTTILLDVPSEGHYAILIKPEPSSEPLLTDPDGHTAEEFEGGHAHDHDDHDDEATETTSDGGLSNGAIWGNSLAGTFIGCAASFLSALVVLAVKDITYFEGPMIWFSSGVIVSVSCLHLLGEAGELNDNGWPHNTGLSSALIFGIFMGFAIDELCEFFLGGSHHGSRSTSGSRVDIDAAETDNKAQGEGGQITVQTKGSAGDAASPSVQEVDTGPKSFDKIEAKNSRKAHDHGQGSPAIGWTCLVGDFAHNFFDGFIIAEAFDSCGTSKGWSLSLAILIHELPQEMSDFYVLIKGGWSATSALMANVGVSLTAFLGVVVYMAMKDDMSKDSVSYFLAISAGCFIYIGIDIIGHISQKAHKHNFLILFICFWAGFGVMAALMEWHPVCHVVTTIVNADGTVEVIDEHEGHDH